MLSFFKALPTDPMNLPLRFGKPVVRVYLCKLNCKTGTAKSVFFLKIKEL